MAHQLEQRQQRKGHPLRGQQLGLGQVGHPVRRKAKDRSRHQPSSGGARQGQYQEIGAKTREHKGQEQGHVVAEHRIAGRRRDRQRQQPVSQQQLRVSQSAGIGVKDIGVEQV